VHYLGCSSGVGRPLGNRESVGDETPACHARADRLSASAALVFAARARSKLAEQLRRSSE
jgi:hypothetical protein